MYSKLNNKKNNLLNLLILNVLLCLPFLTLLAGSVLLEKNIFISSIPFKNYCLYFIFASVPAYLFYKFLMPLHELGHYLVAVFFKKKHHLSVDIWMDRKHTFCSNWREYNSKEAKLILCAGMHFKFTYCIVIILIFAKMNIKFGIMTFIYVIWFEVVLNTLPIQKDTDGYKLIYTDAFYNEKIEHRNIKEEQLVKKVYPWFLAGMTVVTIVLFYKVDNTLILLIDTLISIKG